MLLIVEIILTVMAWRKGWKAVALIPPASALVIGMTVGAVQGEITGTVMVVGLFCDLLVIGCLAAMVRNPRVEKPRPATLPVLSTAVPSETATATK